MEAFWKDEFTTFETPGKAGVGGDLVNLKLIQDNKFDELTILAKKYTEQI